MTQGNDDDSQNHTSKYVEMGVASCQDDGDDLPNFPPQQMLILTLYNLTSVEVGMKVSSS